MKWLALVALMVMQGGPGGQTQRAGIVVTCTKLNDGPAIQAGLDSAQTVYPQGQCDIRSTLTLRTDSRINCGEGILNWNGDPNGSMFTDSPEVVTARTGVESCQIVATTMPSGIVFNLHSTQDFHFDRNYVQGGGQTTAMRIRSDSATSTNTYDVSKNVEFGTINNNFFVNMGVGLDIKGKDSTAVVTNMQIEGNWIWNIRGTAIRIANWVDTLRMAYINCSIESPGSICYDMNYGGSPDWPAMQISCFRCTAEGSAGVGGRTGIVWEANTRQNNFTDFQFDPRIETQNTDNTQPRGTYGSYNEMSGWGNLDYRTVFGTLATVDITVSGLKNPTFGHTKVPVCVDTNTGKLTTDCSN